MTSASPLIRTFSQHCRELHGCAVGKIPLDLGVPCPNRRLGGCIFCSAESYTPASLEQSTSLEEQLHRGRTVHLQGRHRFFYGYFQQETPTALKPDLFMQHADLVLQQPDCLGLIISTRPDYVRRPLLERLNDLVARKGKQCLLELGLQTAHDRSLQFLQRNHTLDDFLQATELIGQFSHLASGAHLILGIPGEDRQHMRASIDVAVGAGVSALKLHHLQVIRNTPLHPLYEAGKVSVYSLESFMELLCTLIPHIPPHITIHRLWATAHPRILVAPRWNIRTAELSVTLRTYLQERGLKQGCHCE
ncbi:TIGR01212 family radical SAM protein [Desulfogranum japonicum]|uniref:TIGR01212 family radical SAM protein n=1 Tax=Desulfogranum japonicum TaxID=231447 RepID=UPI0003FDB1B9|nr:TIGR01212 family radical SAM protein [Desulfogranum japonicum]